MQRSKDALSALKQKYAVVPDVRSLSDEQKAWLQMKIQTLCGVAQEKNIVLALQKIGNRLAHATEDLSDSELQKIVSFVFENMGEIEKIVSV
ncbi:MAG: hypothetical protein IKO57_04190 [Treponema sp.]|nr:hypothetical protein [Treponema sp.]